jgi:hypothetical protein
MAEDDSLGVFPSLGARRAIGPGQPYASERGLLGATIVLEVTSLNLSLHQAGRAATGKVTAEEVAAVLDTAVSAIKAVTALIPAPYPGLERELHLTAYTTAATVDPSVRCQAHGALQVIARLRPVSWLTQLTTAPHSLAGGELTDAAMETAWDLAAATPVYDPYGLAASSRQRALEIVARPEVALQRALRGRRMLSIACSKLIRLACVAKPAVRARCATRLARALHAMPQAMPQDAGAVGLGARILRTLVQAGGRPLPTWQGLWLEAAAAARDLPLEHDPLGAMLMAHGMAVCEGHHAPPGFAELPPPPPALARQTLALVRSLLAARGLASSPAIAGAVASCQRILDAGHPEPALILIRGFAADWLGNDPEYLRVCGAWPWDAGPVRPHEAWPVLLGGASSMLVAAQAVLAVDLPGQQETRAARVATT